MSSPIDLPDYITTVGAPPPQLLLIAINDAVPKTYTQIPCSVWQSIEIQVNFLNAVTAHDVITLTLTWLDGSGGSIVWVDKFTVWSSTTVNVRTTTAFINAPVRGTAVIIDLASTGANDTVDMAVFGTSRVLQAPLCRGQQQAQGLHLLSVTTPSITNGGSLSYYLGPVNRDVTGYVHANGASFFVQVMAQIPIIGGVVESQIAVSSPNAIVGTPGLLGTIPAANVAIRVVVNNNGTSASTCIVALVDSQI